MTQFPGARVLLTGATGGLGRTMARALKERGAEVVLTGRNEAVLAELASELQAQAVVADLATRSGLLRLLQEAGPVDIAVVNAALPASGDLQDWEPDEIDRVLEVNLAGPIALAHAVLPRMRANQRGHLVFISSLSGKVGSPGTALYSATKFGMRGFAAGLRCDLHGTGVGCSTVFPGFVRDAGMFVDSGASLPPYLRTVSPDQVARAVVKAVEKDCAELDVAPLSQRAGAVLGSLAPKVSAVVQARFGSSISAQITANQRHLRS